MIEIMVLIGLSKSISDVAKSQGRAPALYVVLLIISWLIGEVTGVVVANIMAATSGEEASILFVLGMGLAGAAVGACIAFGIANLCGPTAAFASEETDALYQEPSREDPVVHFLKQADSSRSRA